MLTPVHESRQASSGNHFLHIKGLTEVTATLGDNVTLLCNFSTDNSMELTMLDISWSKGGETKWAFSKDTQVNISVLEELSKGKAYIHLMNVQQEHGGRYTCAIKYRSLEERINTTVLVRDPDGLRSTSDSRDGLVSSLDFTPTSQNPEDPRPPSTLASQDIDVDSNLYSIPASKKTTVPASEIIGNDKFRTLKVGMVAAVLVASWVLIFFIYFCLPV
ncbi:hypothetical protein AB205_0044000 [Aquarana catesbeiana]|uniref:Ig-like domain-containing protein n=1 Tax=Aquarana catesbeiana TaxID=8400 RepID=A0A2G9R8Z7_AQUCT|nr:hypothetical protein AB205_0044000 [Aquarana catesbeiana]